MFQPEHPDARTPQHEKNGNYERKLENWKLCHCNEIIRKYRTYYYFAKDHRYNSVSNEFECSLERAFTFEQPGHAKEYRRKGNPNDENSCQLADESA